MLFLKQNGFKLGLLLYQLLWLIGCFWLAGLVRSGKLTTLLGVELAAVEPYSYYALSGAIGGTLYSMRLFHEFYETMSERWVVWYLVRPMKCAAAAVMTIILFQSGIMLLQTGSSLSAKVGIAFLVGFGYGKLMDKLKLLTETLFNGSGDKPSLPSDDRKPKGSENNISTRNE
ncbi:hypothetical protein [Paenibacillus silviterrae]|uniref:hypothetical protein n=1 Tax=Paenibacillus silviterrae TaxID=3242194 RepID=UPI002543A0F5|nr:hypothetical protein [Paenibacillus chinjuensis]